ncbi:hypothetical protein [Geoglobus acetivorans]|uniref:Histone deacetylase domain-containing protein n=1 Tax=Geoglobus acetivorans TaxID=565033 RepID=A0ABZ3H205_GEOAI|nr:hypothetical protein [Geoglobus acetivorans]
MPSSKRVRGPVHSTAQHINPESYILKIHSRKYYEKVKNTPFFKVAYESIRCVLTSAEEIENYNLVIVPTTATGHQAEREKWRGYSFFNDITILVERLKDKGYEKIAVLETDAHHSDTYRICSASFYCINGDRKCEVVQEMKCRISRGLDKEDYLKRFSRVVDLIMDDNPEIVIWYLGQDLHELEYSGGGLDDDAFRAMIEKFMRIETRKIVIISSGTREDVFERIISFFESVPIISA